MDDETKELKKDLMFLLESRREDIRYLYNKNTVLQSEIADLKAEMKLLNERSADNAKFKSHVNSLLLKGAVGIVTTAILAGGGVSFLVGG